MGYKKKSYKDLSKKIYPYSGIYIFNFVKNLPKNTGYHSIILVFITWLIACFFIWHITLEAKKLNILNINIESYKNIEASNIKQKIYLVDKGILISVASEALKTYGGLDISSPSNGEVVVFAQNTDYFSQFVAVISYFENRDKDWAVKIKEFCTGRNCKRKGLYARLKVSSIINGAI